MINLCKRKWDENKTKLRDALSKDETLNICGYLYLVKRTVEHILNNGSGNNSAYDFDSITEIDNGDYQGTLLYLIPETGYQPCCADYLMTYSYYGSCSGCDTLQSIQSWEGSEKTPTERQLDDYMSLCRDLIVNMICPYNQGKSEDFQNAEF